jgi:TP901 family phage tail tape measure protein
LTNSIQVPVEIFANVSSALNSFAKLAKQFDELAKSANKADQAMGRVSSSQAVKSAAKQTSAAVDESTKSLNRHVKQTQLAREQGALLANAWNANSKVIDKRYLNGISGLREALYRLNREFQSSYTYHNGYIKSMNDIDLAHTRFRMQGNLISRTLSNMSTHVINMGKNAQWTGRQLMVGITMPLTGLGIVAGKSALEIEKLDVALRKVTTGLSEGEWKALDDQTRQFSEGLGIARKEIKGVQTELARAGFAFNDIIQGTEKIVNLSIVGDVDVASAQELVRVLKQGGLGWAELQDQLEKFNYIDDQTNLSLKETIGALKEAYPTARRFGSTAAEVAALMAGITQGGYDASKAANTLNNMLVKLPTALANIQSGDSGGKARLKDLQEQLDNVARKTGKTLKLFDDNGGAMKNGVDLLYGLAQGYDMLLKSGDPNYKAGALQLLRALAGTEYSAEASQLFETLIDKQSDLGKAMAIARGELGSYNKEWEEQLKLVKEAEYTKIQGQIEKLKNSAADIGKKLLPYAIQLLNAINKLVAGFSGMSEKTQKLIISMTIGLAALGPIIYAGGQALIVLGSTAKGLIAPFKSFFNMVKRHGDDWDWTEHATESMMKLNEQRRKGEIGHREYVSSLDALMKASKESSLSAGTLASATQASTAQSVANTQALNAQATAQLRLNAAQAAGSSITASRAGTSAVASAMMAGTTLGSRTAEKGAVTTENAVSNVRNRVYNSLVQRQGGIPSFQGVKAEKVRVMGPEGLVGSSDYERAKMLERIIRKAEADIDAFGDRGTLNMLARMQAEAEPLDLSPIYERQNFLRTLRAKLYGFQNEWGQGVPIELNYDIADPFEQLVDFDRNFDEFAASMRALKMADIADLDDLADVPVDIASLMQRRFSGLESNLKEFKRVWGTDAPVFADTRITNPFKRYEKMEYDYDRFISGLTPIMNEMSTRMNIPVEEIIIGLRQDGPDAISAIWHDAFDEARQRKLRKKGRAPTKVAETIGDMADQIVSSIDSAFNADPENLPFLTPYLLGQFKEDIADFAGMNQLYGAGDPNTPGYRGGKAGEFLEQIDRALATAKANATDVARQAAGLNPEDNMLSEAAIKAINKQRKAEGKEPLVYFTQELKKVVSSSREKLPKGSSGQFRDFQTMLNKAYLTFGDRNENLISELDQALESGKYSGQNLQILGLQKKRAAQMAARLDEAMSNINRDLAAGIVPDMNDIADLRKYEMIMNSLRQNSAKIIGGKPTKTFGRTKMFQYGEGSVFDSGKFDKIFDAEGNIKLPPNTIRTRMGNKNRLSSDPQDSQVVGSIFRGEESPLSTYLSTTVNNGIFGDKSKNRGMFVERGVSKLNRSLSDIISKDSDAVQETLVRFIESAFNDDDVMNAAVLTGLPSALIEPLSRSLYAGYDTSEALKPIKDMLSKEQLAKANYILNQLAGDIMESYDNVDMNQVLDYRRKAIDAKKAAFNDRLDKAERELLRMGKNKDKDGNIKDREKYDALAQEVRETYMRMSPDDLRDRSLRKMAGGKSGTVSTNTSHTSTRGMTRTEVQAFAPEALDMTLGAGRNNMSEVAGVDELMSYFGTKLDFADPSQSVKVAATKAVSDARKAEILIRQQLDWLDNEDNQIRIDASKDRTKRVQKRTKRERMRLVRQLSKAQDAKAEAEANLAKLGVDALKVTYADGSTKIYPTVRQYIEDVSEKQKAERARLMAEAEKLLGFDDMPVQPQAPRLETGKGSDVRNKALQQKHEADMDNWRRDLDQWAEGRSRGAALVKKELDKLELEEIKLAEFQNERFDVMRERAMMRFDDNAKSLEKRDFKRELLGGRRNKSLGADELQALQQMQAFDVEAGRGERRFTRSQIAQFIATPGILSDTDDLFDAPVFGPAAPTRRQKLQYAAQNAGTRLDDTFDSMRGPNKMRRGAAAVGRSTVANKAFTVANVAANPVKQVSLLRGGVKKLGESFTGMVKEGGKANMLMQGMFGTAMANSASSVILAVTPWIPILILIAGLVLILWKNFDKWIDSARPGLEKLKEAGILLIRAVIDPLKGVFIRLGKEGGEAGSMWENVGKIIGFVASVIAVAFKIVTPIIKIAFETIADVIYIIIQIIRVVIAIITGDWKDAWEGTKEIFGTIWEYYKRITSIAVKAIIQAMFFLIKTVIKGWGYLADGARKVVAAINPIGGAGPLENVNKVKDGLLDAVDDLEQTLLDSVWSSDSSNTKAAENAREAGEAYKKEHQKWLDDINGRKLDPNWIDPEEAKKAAEEAAKEIISAFKSRMQKVVDGWKNAALEAYDTWADAQIDAIDEKLEAIDKEVEAERKRDEDLEYLRRKEELRERRRSQGVKFRADRALAIYEGRYDDAKQMSYDYAVSLKDIKKEEDNLDSDRNKTLVQRERDLQKEVLNEQKEGLKKQLDERRKQFEKELELYTEYLPRNADAAAAMQEGILSKLRGFTDQHGTIGANQAEAWGKNWESALVQASADVENEAYWAGNRAIKEFARGLGIDESVLNPGRGYTYTDEAMNDGFSREPGMAGGDYDVNSQGGFSWDSGLAGGDYSVVSRIKRHSGGSIPGAGEVDATLLSGEYVMQRSAVNKYGPAFMEQVNAGQLKYHSGGMVGMAADAMKMQFRKFYSGFMDNAGSFNLGRGDTKVNVTAEKMKVALSNAVSGGTDIVANMVEGIYPEFMQRFNRFNAAVGNKFKISSGYRSLAEQQKLYDLYLSGKGNLAAPPGSSYHNFGLAMDLSPNSTSDDRDIAARYGLRFPMSFEPWHIEPVDAASIKQSMMSGMSYTSKMMADTEGAGIKLRADLIKRHSGGMVVSNIPSLDVGGVIARSGIAEVHKNERVLTAAETAAYNSSASKIEAHFHFEGGYFGTDRELEKLVDRMEKEIIPKVNRPRTGSTRVYGGVTKK